MSRLTVLLLSGLVGMASASLGQTVLMKDGKKVVAKSLRRSGDIIMAGSPAVDGGPEAKGEVGYPISQIEKIDFPEPAILKAAPEMIASGKVAEALVQLDGALTYYGAFRDAPGSYWADLAMLKLTGLAVGKRDAEAEPLAKQVAEQASNPETIRAAQAHLAGILGRKGDHEAAIVMADKVLKDGSRPDSLATAAISKALSHQALKHWDTALLAFLNIPVFYPEQKAFVPQYLLGAAQCYFELADLPRAKDALNELVKTFPNAPESTTAKTELDKIARREKALEKVP